MPTIARYALGVLLLAHGDVHFVYVASSRGWFATDDGWGWNGRSWLLSGVLAERRVLDVASVGFVLAAAGFAAGGIGYVLGTGWWAPLLVASAVLSAVLYVALWDGEPTGLFEKGRSACSSTSGSSSGCSSSADAGARRHRPPPIFVPTTTTLCPWSM